MDMKYISKILNEILHKLNLNKRGGILMLKLLSKIAEKYAKNTNTASFFFTIWHQPKMPANLVKKD